MKIRRLSVLLSCLRLRSSELNKNKFYFKENPSELQFYLANGTMQNTKNI